MFTGDHGRSKLILRMQVAVSAFFPSQKQTTRIIEEFSISFSLAKPLRTE